MKPIKELFRNCSMKCNLDDGFETKVFAKIKRKKTIKKIGYSFTAFFVMGLILFLSFYFIRPDRDQDNALKSKYATKFPRSSEESIVTKEEIPVIEVIIFASSDEGGNYAIEQVSYSEEDEDGI